MAYDGHLFHGFQLQPDQRTVQGTIEDALKKMTKGQRVIVQGSGRTDAGVHAVGQVIHFDYLDENGVLYTVSGFENLQYGLTKVQISDDYDKYVVDGENRYLCLTVDTLNKLTGIG